MKRVFLLCSCLWTLSGCDADAALKVATSVVKAVTEAPKRASEAKKSALRFWKGVTAAARRVSTPPSRSPARASNRARKKIHTTIKNALTSAVQLAQKADGTCAGYGLESDGDAFCDDDGGGSYVVFCDQGQAYALECAVFADDASCGEVEDLIDCGTVPESSVDPELADYDSFAADSNQGCSPESEGAAECEEGYVVYCADGEVKELDCGTFEADGERATCGALDGTVTCGFDH